MQYRKYITRQLVLRMVLFIGIIAGAVLFDSFHKGSSEVVTQAAQRAKSIDVHSSHLFVFNSATGSVPQLDQSYRLQVRLLDTSGNTVNYILKNFFVRLNSSAECHSETLYRKRTGLLFLIAHYYCFLAEDDSAPAFV